MYSKGLFARNTGLISNEEQQRLANASILIAGVGGDGGLLAERLARIGIGQLILADPEAFETANINRQYAANITTIGTNKAEAVARELSLINPGLKVIVCVDGITDDNVAALVEQADVVVDEIEYTKPSISVILHREARKQEKYVFMAANIGWGASSFCFAPKGKTFEQHFEYDEINSTINPLAYLKAMPGYISNDLTQAVLTGAQAMPAISASVSLVAAIMTTEIICFLTIKKAPIIMPQFISIDLFNLTINCN